MDITGKAVEIFATQQVSDKFRKREIVVEYASNPKYPELIKFEFVQDKCDLLDGFKVGQEVRVYFDLKGRKWTDRNGKAQYFTTLQGWRISKEADAEDPTTPPPFQPTGNDDLGIPF